jgi:hypothetical protein
VSARRKGRTKKVKKGRMPVAPRPTRAAAKAAAAPVASKEARAVRVAKVASKEAKVANKEAAADKKEKGVPAGEGASLRVATAPMMN